MFCVKSNNILARHSGTAQSNPGARLARAQPEVTMRPPNPEKGRTARLTSEVPPQFNVP